MVNSLQAFSKFKPIRVLVVGDYMLDAYKGGRVERISPEAPVLVLKVEKENTLPGGAGNVVLNLLSLGAEVMTLGRIGEDQKGQLLKELLKKEGASVNSLKIEKNYNTIKKTRLIAESQQLLRIDDETLKPLSSELEEAIIRALPKILVGCDIIAISDYGKGFLSETLLSNLILQAKKRSIPVLVDPKGSDFSKYRGATLIKPNFKEAIAAAKLPKNTPIKELAQALLAQSQAEMIMITRSEKGISLFDRENRQRDFPAIAKEVTDVTGAGDTVLAFLTMALGNQIDIESACQLANVGASIAIEHMGCKRISLKELSERLLHQDVANKEFDEEHLFTLMKILEDQEFALLGINDIPAITPTLYAHLERLSNQFDRLILYCSHTIDPSFITLFKKLTAVDFIILKKENLAKLCNTLKPKKAYFIESEELILMENPEELVEQLIDLC
ncbi:MAG: D-glycero-beta-D-manno-heptose-7-phosphate kinase [Simkaniaceae bacterium]